MCLAVGGQSEGVTSAAAPVTSLTVAPHSRLLRPPLRGSLRRCVAYTPRIGTIRHAKAQPDTRRGYHKEVTRGRVTAPATHPPRRNPLHFTARDPRSTDPPEPAAFATNPDKRTDAGSHLT